MAMSLIEVAMSGTLFGSSGTQACSSHEQVNFAGQAESQTHSVEPPQPGSARAERKEVVTRAKKRPNRRRLIMGAPSKFLLACYHGGAEALWPDPRPRYTGEMSSTPEPSKHIQVVQPPHFGK